MRFGQNIKDCTNGILLLILNFISSKNAFLNLISI